MKAPRTKTETEKLSVSLSKKVYAWAVQLADKKGLDTNFSAYIADLIRRDMEREGDARERPAPFLAASTLELNAPTAHYKTRKP